MKWDRIGSGDTGLTAWIAEGDGRHLLLFDATSGELRELHEVPGGPVTVHVYQPDDWYEGRTESHGDLSAVVYPLLETTHLRTHEVPAEHAPWVRALDDREVFEYLAAAGYAS